MLNIRRWLLGVCMDQVNRRWAAQCEARDLRRQLDRCEEARREEAAAGAAELSAVASELSRARAGREASDRQHEADCRELETQIDQLQSKLRVRELEVAELTALVGSLHAKVELCTAVSCRETQEAKHGPIRRAQR